MIENINEICARVDTRNFLEEAIQQVRKEIGIKYPNEEESTQILQDYGVVVAAIVQAIAQNYNSITRDEALKRSTESISMP